MASPLTQRALRTIGDSGFAKAKKLADLALKTNTDSSGGYTASGYEQAISILQPYLGSGKETEAIDAQRLIASYNNNLSKIQGKEKDQNETVAAFKLQEHDSYFSSFDGDVGGFRSPGDLITATSESLDNLLLGVINAIDEKEASGESTDALYGYLNDLQKRADTLRDVRNKYESGQLSENQVLDGFGYYVDTNPIDGSVRGAALLPAGMAPDGIADGYRRLDATTKLGNAMLPVYAPAQKDAMGEYIARVGDATWSGGGDGALRASKATNNKSLFEPGNFSISDATAFPVRKNTIEKGQFGSALVGRDSQGNPIDGVFYRGLDGKLYSVDEQSLNSFKSDPILASKLNGYIPRFSPSEAQELAKESTPFTDERLGRESKIAGLQQDTEKYRAEAERLQNMGFFDKVNEGFRNNVSEGVDKVSSFFSDRVNKPNKPDQAPTGGTGSDIVEGGKSFFRKVGSFFGQ